MDIDQRMPLLGGLSPQAFMRRHWQKKPLLVRQAWPGVVAPLSRAALFDLAGRDDVESRLIVRNGPGGPNATAAGTPPRRGTPAVSRSPHASWSLRPGPLPRRALPSLKTPCWTLLVQGLDLHVSAAHDMLSRFRFVPEARLDDLMVSFATDGGGVGAHLDSYDVFLLQVQGRRRWRIGRVAQPRWEEGVPLKLLANFEAEAEWLLEPGDMLYLPPMWGHDGVADGECMTVSIGFNAPPASSLAQSVLQRVIDGVDPDDTGKLYRDPKQPATDTPGRVPDALAGFAQAAVKRLLDDPATLACALGEVLTEPKPAVWFEAGDIVSGAIALDRRTRMMYDARHVFINGESFRTAGRDASLMHRLADQRALSAADMSRLGDGARELLDEWARAGWLRPSQAA